MAQTSTAYDNALYTPQPAVEVEQPKVRKASKQKAKANLVVRASVAVLFLMIFTVVLRYTMINERLAQINSLEKELQELTAANEQHMVYLDRSSDLKSVEQTAKTELNMGVPQSHQVVNVSLNMKDKTIKPVQEKNGFLNSAKSVISYCLEYLY